MSTLSSINFPFLASLAVTSWIILCYFHKIEERKLEDFDVNLNIEGGYVDEAIVPYAFNTCQPNYDIYLNIICIFACIYCLAKVANFTENYIVRRFHSKFHYGFNTKNESSNLTNDYKMKLQKLIVQVIHLENQNKLLENRLQTFPEKSLHFAGEYDEEAVLKNAQSRDSRTQNIFISNRHFYMKRQVFINEGNMKLTHPTKEYDNFSHIWNNYYELQQLINTIDDTAGAGSLKEAHSLSLPAVTSLDELQSNEDLYKCL